MSALRDEILETRKRLDELEKEYCATYPKCTKTDCGLFNANYANHCSWSVLTEECKDYIPEES